MATKEVSLLNYQSKALSSRKAEVLVSGGIGVGKSHLGSHWCLNKIIENPGCDILIAANTYSQLMNASVKTFTSLLEDLGIEYKAVLSGARKRIEIGNSTCFLYSLDKPDSIRGIEVSFSWLDEIAFSTLNALNVVRGRMRGSKSDYRQVLMTSSPNGFNFLYDLFGSLPEGDMKREVIYCKTKDNIFLPDDYYLTLVDNYGGEDTPLAQQELFGRFVNLQEGAIYNLFERDTNLRPCKLDPKYPLYIAVDFNVDVMSAVASQFINGKLYVCEETQLTHRNANTFDMASHIVSEYVNKGFNTMVVPDSTGRARKTSSSSGQSDHQILRDAGLRVLETSNPLIRDRQQSVNIGFKKETVIIDPSCCQLIKDIETLSSRDKEGSVSHLGPCLGYLVWYLSPIKRRTSKSRQLHI